jgi:hypothetical protein
MCTVKEMWKKYRDGSGFVHIPDFMLPKLVLIKPEMSNFNDFVNDEWQQIVVKTTELVNNISCTTQILILKLTSEEWLQVCEYDKKITGGEERSKWLRLWMTKHPAGYGRVALDSNGQVVGYGQIRDGDTNKHAANK